MLILKRKNIIQLMGYCCYIFSVCALAASEPGVYFTNSSGEDDQCASGLVNIGHNTPGAPMFGTGIISVGDTSIISYGTLGIKSPPFELTIWVQQAEKYQGACESEAALSCRYYLNTTIGVRSGMNYKNSY